MARLTAELDRSEIDATTAAFEKLRLTIEAVNVELEKLGDKKQGGITISAVGSIVQCEVKPAAERVVIQEDIINRERCVS